MIYYLLLIYIGSRIFYRNPLPLPNRKCNCNLIVGNTKILDLIKKNKIVYLKETITNISQKEVMKKIITKLIKENVSNDINGYPKAPPSIRIWGGSTIQNNDMKALLPWIDWAYHSVKNNA